MSLATLVQAVNRFAAATVHLNEHHLNQPSYRWDDYEQVRYAFLHSTLEIRQLAATLYQQRYHNNLNPSYVQHTLTHHQQIYRECLGLLAGISDETALKPPAPHEWPVRDIFLHMYRTERYFYATIRKTLEAQVNRQPAQPVSENEIYTLAEETGDPETADTPLSVLKERFETLHNRIVQTLATLSEGRSQLASPMWETKAYPIRFRLHRFESHLHEHINQLEKTLAALGLLTEPRLLLRQMYNALGEVEGAIAGANMLGYVECLNTAAIISDRITEIKTAVAQTNAILKAVEAGETNTVKELLDTNPRLVNTVDTDGLFLIVKAAYNHDWDTVKLLLAMGAFLDVWEAAAAGSLEQAQAWLAHSPQDLNGYARDGFTPLQLACYFNHEALALFLLDQGADVTLVSQNALGLQALHAAATHGNPVLIKALLDRGADANARQASGSTPLDAARENEDVSLAELLQQYGAKDEAK
ncbi:MAG: ankyrin repeat domain-containing protein [Chloroflexi bacterium]|nr:ankyrin repeat domain-containing protein [Chloroflexota bacterium]MBP8055718.1 ankyrin repeat domain-containing protein [Chloroflexota bacterium]